jgi:thiosulfate dehydrogenase
MNRRTSYIVIIPLTIFFFSAAFAADVDPYRVGQKVDNEQADALQKSYSQREKQPWKTAASIDTLKTHKNAELIKYGIQVLDKTNLTIGPDVSDKSHRYSANRLNCSSCHLKGDTQLPGSQYDALPFTNVSNDYPRFRSRGMSIISAADRVNGCMTRSMGNGKELPLDSKEMKGILAYYDWLAEGTKKNLAMQGTSVPKLALPARQASVKNGEAVYKQYCVACHGSNALGTKAADYDKTGGYTFPPLAGDDSFNDGAGMSRLIKATEFVHANMPLGTTSKKPALSIDQAYDVAAYFLSLPRPHRQGREKDFPDPAFRPADYPVPEYFHGDEKAIEKARLGPFTN